MFADTGLPGALCGNCMFGRCLDDVGQMRAPR